MLNRIVLIPAVVGAVLGLAIILLSSSDNDKPGYAAAVAAAAPAVVNIYTTKITQQGRLCRIPAYRELCRRFPTQAQVQNSLGSGVVVRSDGYVLTNEHVVDEADEILVMFANNQTTVAEVIGTDPLTDLAVIRVDAQGLPTIPLPEPDDPARVGDITLAIGNPFGFGHSVSQGIISAFSRTIITDSPYDEFIQTDAAISPGNSGGALVDHRGRLLGINSLIYSQSGGNEGIGFAIPATIALRVLDDILDHGRVIRGWLGVSLGRSADGTGLRVMALTRGGPAMLAGIRAGDVLLSVNGLSADSPQAIIASIAATQPGHDVEIEVMRDKARFNVTAIAQELPTR